MTPREITAGITSTIRNGITQARSTSVQFMVKLPIVDAALLGAVIGAVLGWRQAWVNF